MQLMLLLVRVGALLLLGLIAAFYAGVHVVERSAPNHSYELQAFGEVDLHHSAQQNAGPHGFLLKTSKTWVQNNLLIRQARRLHETWKGANRTADSSEEFQKEALPGQGAQAKLNAIERQLRHLNEVSDGEEEEDVQVHPSRSMRWDAMSIACASLFGFVCLVCQGSCLFWCAVGAPISLMAECTCRLFKGGGYETLDSDAEVALIIRREMRITMIYILVPWLAFFQTSCEAGSPTWLYVVYLPLLLRAKLVEVKMLRHLGKTSLVWSVGFILGVFEQLDFFTDGVFPVQAMKCDPEATQLFASAFAESKMPFVAPLVSAVHFWGLAYILLSATILAQQAIAVFGMQKSLQLSCAAEVPGFGAVAAHFDAKAADGHGGQGNAPFFFAVTRVLLENCSQLWLQSSYFGIVFDQVTQEARRKLLLSMGLGLASTTYKAFVTTRLILVAYHAPGEGFRKGPVSNPSMLVFPAMMLAMIAWVSAKLYYSWHCEHHIWNITSGCVSADM